MDVQQGVAGHPIPYSISHDDAMILPLLVGFCIVVALVGYYRKFIQRQFKQFFFDSPVAYRSGMTKEERFMVLTLMLGTCMLLSYVTSFYVADHHTAGLTGKHLTLVMTSLWGVFFGFFFLKWGLYQVVNLLFFGGKKTLQWSDSFQLLVAFEGLLLMPIMVLQIFGGMQWEFVMICTIIVVFLNKMLTFYKVYRTFFHKNDDFVPFFLYFCALEITPVLAFVGILQKEIDSLEINF